MGGGDGVGGIGVGGAVHPCAQHRQPTSVSLAQLRLVWLKQQESATSPQPDSVHLSLHSAGQQNADFVDTMPPVHHGDAERRPCTTLGSRRKRAAAIVRCMCTGGAAMVGVQGFLWCDSTGIYRLVFIMGKVVE